MKRDEGTVLVMAIGGVLLAVIVTVTLFDLGGVYFRWTALMNAANDVALQASTAIDVDALYRGSIGSQLVLDPLVARQRAALAVSGNRDPHLPDLRLDEVVVDGSSVRVVVSVSIPPPLGRISGNRSMRMRASAAAMTPTRF